MKRKKLIPSKKKIMSILSDKIDYMPQPLQDHLSVY